MVVNSIFKIPNALELLKSLKNARSEWKLKTPMQKWCYFYGIGRAALGFLCFPLLNDVNRVHWFGYFWVVYFILITLLSLNTVYYYAIRGQLEMGLPSTCLAAFLMGHIPMGWLYVSKGRFILQSLIDFGGRYIYRDTHDKSDYSRICSNHMDRTMKLFIIEMGSMHVAYSACVIGPVYAFTRHGVLSTFVETRIPFTEPNSDAEFVGNFFLQSVIGVHGMIGFIGLECFLLLLQNVVTITPRLVKSELEHTIHLYEEKSITELELHLRIGNIVKQSNDADNYVDSLSELFYWRNLFTPIFTYVMGMAIFCQYTMSFYAGYGMAVMCWVQLFYVCELGENIQDNGFDEMLYQTNWEILPLKVQKAIMLLIHRKQNEEGLSLGPFGVGINRESFKLVRIKDVETYDLFKI